MEKYLPYSNDVVEFNVDQRYITKKYTEEAIDFIRRHAKETIKFSILQIN
jgi:hypothetical protein